MSVRPDLSSYDVRVTHRRRAVYTCIVREPRVSREAIDAAPAFDGAAHAAMSFFADESEDFDDGVAGLSESGWAIGRSTRRSP